MGRPRRRISRICVQCGQPFERRPSELTKGRGGFCSIGCSTTHRNIRDNPAKKPEVQVRISANHADVSGPNNPMYGRRGKEAPGYIDGRNSIGGVRWRQVALAERPPICERCGRKPSNPKNLHIHHKDQNRDNNSPDNLEVLCSTCHNRTHALPRDRRGRFVSLQKAR